MDTTLLLRPRTVGAVELVTLAGFVGYLVLPDGARLASLVVMTAAAALSAASAIGWTMRRRRSTGLAAVTVACSAGLVGSVLYLRSLADEPSAIPLVGMFVLLVSLVGTLVTALVLSLGARDR